MRPFYEWACVILLALAPCLARADDKPKHTNKLARESSP